ncbi:MAG TPA: RNA methyltransferase [Thermoanaerobaculia bacterium]|nr:RNA methyltransferase [Thermoanaerobaculia bacterium]
MSRQNRTLKDMRRLRRSKGALALLEGPHLVAAAQAAGLPIETVLATPEFLASPAGGALAAGLPCPPLTVEARLLDELADADSPRGLLAVAQLPRGGVEALPARAGGIYLYVEGLQDPGNLGALARVAEAAGAAGMALSPGTVHPNHPRALRASAGSLLRLPVAVGVEPDLLDRRLSMAIAPAAVASGAPPAAAASGTPAAAPCWVVLVPRGGADLYDEPPRAGLGETLILALGSEGPGVSPALLARAELRLTIPVAPPVESLNATVAAALTLFELRRRRSGSAPSPAGPALANDGERGERR